MIQKCLCILLVFGTIIIISLILNRLVKSLQIEMFSDPPSVNTNINPGQNISMTLSSSPKEHGIQSFLMPSNSNLGGSVTLNDRFFIAQYATLSNAVFPVTRISTSRDGVYFVTFEDATLKLFGSVDMNYIFDTPNSLSSNPLTTYLGISYSYTAFCGNVPMYRFTETGEDTYTLPNIKPIKSKIVTGGKYIGSNNLTSSTSSSTPQDPGKGKCWMGSDVCKIAPFGSSFSNMSVKAKFDGIFKPVTSQTVTPSAIMRDMVKIHVSLNRTGYTAYPLVLDNTKADLISAGFIDAWKDCMDSRAYDSKLLTNKLIVSIATKSLHCVWANDLALPPQPTYNPALYDMLLYTTYQTLASKNYNIRLEYNREPIRCTIVDEDTLDSLVKTISSTYTTIQAPFMGGITTDNVIWALHCYGVIAVKKTKYALTDLFNNTFEEVASLDPSPDWKTHVTTHYKFLFYCLNVLERYGYALTSRYYQSAKWKYGVEKTKIGNMSDSVRKWAVLYWGFDNEPDQPPPAPAPVPTPQPQTSSSTSSTTKTSNNTGNTMSFNTNSTSQDPTTTAVVNLLNKFKLSDKEFLFKKDYSSISYNLADTIAKQKGIHTALLDYNEVYSTLDRILNDLKIKTPTDKYKYDTIVKTAVSKVANKNQNWVTLSSTQYKDIKKTLFDVMDPADYKNIETILDDIFSRTNTTIEDGAKARKFYQKDIVSILNIYAVKKNMANFQVNTFVLTELDVDQIEKDFEPKLLAPDKPNNRAILDAILKDLNVKIVVAQKENKNGMTGMVSSSTDASPAVSTTVDSSTVTFLNPPISPAKFPEISGADYFKVFDKTTNAKQEIKSISAVRTDFLNLLRTTVASFPNVIITEIDKTPTSDLTAILPKSIEYHIRIAMEKQYGSYIDETWSIRAVNFKNGFFSAEVQGTTTIGQFNNYFIPTNTIDNFASTYRNGLRKLGFEPSIPLDDTIALLSDFEEVIMYAIMRPQDFYDPSMMGNYTIGDPTNIIPMELEMMFTNLVFKAETEIFWKQRLTNSQLAFSFTHTKIDFAIKELGYVGYVRPQQKPVDQQQKTAYNAALKKALSEMGVTAKTLTKDQENTLRNKMLSVSNNPELFVSELAALGIAQNLIFVPIDTSNIDVSKLENPGKADDHMKAIVTFFMRAEANDTGDRVRMHQGLTQLATMVKRSFKLTKADIASLRLAALWLTQSKYPSANIKNYADYVYPVYTYAPQPDDLCAYTAYTGKRPWNNDILTKPYTYRSPMQKNLKDGATGPLPDYIMPEIGVKAQFTMTEGCKALNATYNSLDNDNRSPQEKLLDQLKSNAGAAMVSSQSTNPFISIQDALIASKASDSTKDTTDALAKFKEQSCPRFATRKPVASLVSNVTSGVAIVFQDYDDKNKADAAQANKDKTEQNKPPPPKEWKFLMPLHSFIGDTAEFFSNFDTQNPSDIFVTTPIKLNPYYPIRIEIPQDFQLCTFKAAQFSGEMQTYKGALKLSENIDLGGSFSILPANTTFPDIIKQRTLHNDTVAILYRDYMCSGRIRALQNEDIPNISPAIPRFKSYRIKAKTCVWCYADENYGNQIAKLIGPCEKNLSSLLKADIKSIKCKMYQDNFPVQCFSSGNNVKVPFDIFDDNDEVPSYKTPVPKFVIASGVKVTFYSKKNFEGDEKVVIGPKYYDNHTFGSFKVKDSASKTVQKSQQQQKTDNSPPGNHTCRIQFGVLDPSKFMETGTTNTYQYVFKDGNTTPLLVDLERQLGYQENRDIIPTAPLSLVGDCYLALFSDKDQRGKSTIVEPGTPFVPSHGQGAIDYNDEFCGERFFRNYEVNTYKSFSVVRDPKELTDQNAMYIIVFYNPANASQSRRVPVMKCEEFRVLTDFISSLPDDWTITKYEIRTNAQNLTIRLITKDNRVIKMSKLPSGESSTPGIQTLDQSLFFKKSDIVYVLPSNIVVRNDSDIIANGDYGYGYIKDCLG